MTEITFTPSELTKYIHKKLNQDIKIEPLPDEEMLEIEFGRIFGTRSGDKGGCANLGVWAKDDDSYRYLYHFLSVNKLKELMPDLNQFEIDRYELPNIKSLNFYVRGLLENGVSSNNRKDGQAKSLGEYLGVKMIGCPKSLLKK